MQTLAQTAHFDVQYDETLIGPDGNPNAISRAQRVLGVCEAEFGLLANWYNITDGFGPDNRVTVQMVGDSAIPSGGANNNGYKGSATLIKIKNQTSNGDAVAAGQMSCMSFVAELVEVFASYRNKNGNPAWNAKKSDGEGLSLLCGRERFGTGYSLFFPLPWINSWLQSSRDTQWIGTPENTDKNALSFGLSLLFLYYLKSQLNHSIPDIIAAGGDNLAQTYHNLTGKNDAAAAFSQLINGVFPPGSTPQLPTEKSISITARIEARRQALARSGAGEQASPRRPRPPPHIALLHLSKRSVPLVPGQHPQNNDLHCHYTWVRTSDLPLASQRP
jgi:hypothetical protein